MEVIFTRMEMADDGHCQEREEDEDFKMECTECGGICGICWKCSKESCKYNLVFRAEKNELESSVDGVERCMAIMIMDETDHNETCRFGITGKRKAWKGTEGKPSKKMVACQDAMLQGSIPCFIHF